MAHLPRVIHEQILLRLNVRDLLRYKSVCKSWLNLISDPLFINAHLNRNYQNDRDNQEIRYRRVAMYMDPDYIRFNEFDVGLMFYDFNDRHLLGSCDGLVCMIPWSTEIVVVNPSTREVKKVTNPQIPKTEFLCWGFGYDSSMDDYKILLGFRKDESITSFQVYSLISEIWKVIGEENLAFISKVGVFCKGALHLLAYDSLLKKKVIHSFCFSEEKFMEVPEPDDTSYRIHVAQGALMHLGILEDCLCIFGHETIPSSDVWVMKDYNEKQSWKLIGFKRETKHDPIHPMKQLRHYVPHKRPLCYEPWFFQSGVFLGTLPYVESLVSPHFHMRQRRKRRATSTMKSPKVKMNNCVVAGYAIHHAESSTSAGASSSANTSARV